MIMYLIAEEKQHLLNNLQSFLLMNTAIQKMYFSGKLIQYD